MNDILWLICLVVVIFAASRGIWLLVLISAVLLLGFSQQERPHEDKASAYREAQEAVARATGKPCDYACKVMIADQARRPSAE